MSAYVISINGHPRPVKNLGWILRNWKLVDSVKFHYNPTETCNDVMVEFYLKDGRKFMSTYASFTVFLDWIDRPIFRGIGLWIAQFGKTMGMLWVGSGEFHALATLRNS